MREFIWLAEKLKKNYEPCRIGGTGGGGALTWLILFSNRKCSTLPGFYIWKVMLCWPIVHTVGGESTGGGGHFVCILLSLSNMPSGSVTPSNIPFLHNFESRYFALNLNLPLWLMTLTLVVW